MTYSPRASRCYRNDWGPHHDGPDDLPPLRGRWQDDRERTGHQGQVPGLRDNMGDAKTQDEEEMTDGAIYTGTT